MLSKTAVIALAMVGIFGDIGAENAKSGDVSVYPLQAPSGLSPAECNICAAPERQLQGGMTQA